MWFLVWLQTQMSAARRHAASTPHAQGPCLPQLSSLADALWDSLVMLMCSALTSMRAQLARVDHTPHAPTSLRPLLSEAVPVRQDSKAHQIPGALVCDTCCLMIRAVV